MSQIPRQTDNRSIQSPADTTLVEASGITKRFGALTALADINLEIRRGEVLALLGDNGAGKSTFIKVLSGAHQQDAGELRVDGRAVKFDSPQDAADAGIATIFQELALPENLSVTENVFLGRELVRRVAGMPLLRRAAMRDRVVDLLASLDAHVPDVDMPVGSLSGGQRQAVAICRALNLDAKLVIMDEPTAALAVAETRKVLTLARQLAARNCAVVLISHNIADVFEVADRMIVFRRGQNVGERLRENTNPEEIVAFITGAHPDLNEFVPAA